LTDQTPDAEILKTPLHALHLELGARMTPFAGYDMPVQYPLGIMKEHLHTRAQAGLFDVSHMGQVILRPMAGNLADAALALERLVPVDVLGIAEGRQRYALFTNDAGGILDDLMIANRGDHLFLVVNAACKKTDVSHMEHTIGEASASPGVTVFAVPDRALLALQGPAAAAALATVVSGAAEMRFMDSTVLTSAFGELWVSRSGYSGEDGFEISVTNDAAEALARALLAHDAVEPIGLGARDSLRLEAGLCLYGSDLDSDTSPAEASLTWAIQKTRRTGGPRAGGFPGATRILDELINGASRSRVGLLPDGRAPMRGGTELFAGEEDADPIGIVTSGAFGPSLGGPMAMGYVPSGLAATGTRLFAEVRGKRLPLRVADMPFVKPNYKRT
jgi:aminomethyltransferase